MKKKVLSGLLALCLVFGSASALPQGAFDTAPTITASAVSTATSGKCGENVKWKLTDGKLTISGTGEMTDYSNENSPFCDRTDIQTVVIGSGVTSIGNQAFCYCTKLVDITIPDSVTRIGYNAFEGCENLTSVTLPNSIDSIYLQTFMCCYSLESVTLPDSITGIYNGAFYGCKKLKNINIPDSVEHIDTYAFKYCPNLTSLTIPSSVESIGNDAIDKECTIICEKGSKAEKYAKDNGLDYNYSDGDYLYKELDDGTVEITKYSGNYTMINIPSTLGGKQVTSIGSDAFSDRAYLEKIIIPSGVTNIAEKAFASAPGLKKIIIPDSVKSIGDNAFNSKCTIICTKTSFAYVYAALYSIKCEFIAGDYIYKDIDDETVEITGYTGKDKTVNIPSKLAGKTVTSIGDYAFNGWSSLTSITIPNSVTSIGDYAFSRSGLKSITIPNSVTRIGEFAFGACHKLESAVIQAGVETITHDLFAECRGLKSVTIPSSVKSIEIGAFSNCSALTSITIPGNVTYIGASAFEGCTGLKSLTIPSSVETIDNYAFIGCGFTSLTVPKTVTKIGKEAIGYVYNELYSLVKDDNFTVKCYKGSKADTYAQNNKLKIKYVDVKHVAAKAPTCTAKGNIEYWKHDGKFYSDAKLTTEITQAKTVVKATGHKWGTPTWTWDGVKSATAKFTCANDNSHVETVTADITSKTTKATCEKDGKTVYTATVTFNGQTYTKTKTVTIDKLGHKYGEPTWTWDGVKSATAKFTCANDKSHVETVTAKITSKTTKATCTADGKTVYTATVTFGGKTYTDTKTVTITKTGHKWGTPTWTWNGVKSATAKFTCANDKSHTKTVTAKISSTTTKATCEKDGKTVYTATITFNGQTYTNTKTVTITKTGHKFSDWKTTKAPTTKTEGEETRTCLVCKKTEKRAISKLVIDTQRVAGDNRYATAAEIAKAAYPSGAKTVVLANGLVYADALVGVPLAKSLNAPILLATDKSLPRETTNALEKLGTKNVIILGGYGAIGEQVEKTLNNQGITTERYEGKSRFGTAAAIAEKLSKKPTSVFFVYYNDFPDALSASTVAAIKNAPIIYLTTKGDIHPDTAAYLAKLKKAGSVKNAYIIGGTGVIDDDMKNKVGTALGITPKRLAGANRYETCVEVNKYFKNSLSGTSLCLATGADYPDALAGGVFAAIQKAPLFLVNGKVKNLTLSDKQKAYLKTRTTKKIFTLGGKSVVPDSHVRTIVDEY